MAIGFFIWTKVGRALEEARGGKYVASPSRGSLTSLAIDKARGMLLYRDDLGMKRSSLQLLVIIFLTSSIR